jgi:hypothetical protein
LINKTLLGLIMAAYKIGGLVFEGLGEEDQLLLASKHELGARPLCLCKTQGVEMYIARIESGAYIVKRMPNSAQAHAPQCEHFEIPPGLSGLSEVMGSAIQENHADQCTDLKFDFALSKTGKRPPASSAGSEKDSVQANPSRLTLRGLLHHLWSEAGFNVWVPRMAGKRNWYVIRKYLLAAAGGMRSSAGRLHEILYIPEHYDAAEEQAIAARRMGLLSSTAQNSSKGQKLLLCVGEFDRFSVGGSGQRVFLKNAPDFPMLVSDDLYKRISKRFAMELGLFDFFPDAHLMMIATLWVDVSGVAHVDQFSLMMVNDCWLPIESSYEATLFDLLIKEHRYFIKGMRYNLSSDKSLASCMLTDCEPPIALVLESPKQAGEEVCPIDIPFSVWSWNVQSGKMPVLPSAAHRANKP